jgi:hypothetical protein
VSDPTPRTAKPSMKDPGYIALVTTETPETVDFPTLCSHIQFYLPEGGGVCDPRPFTEFPDGTPESVNCAILSASSDPRRVTLIPTLSSALLDHWVKQLKGEATGDDRFTLVGIFTVNSVDALPPPPQATGQQPTGKAAQKKPEPKKADPKGGKKGDKGAVEAPATKAETLDQHFRKLMFQSSPEVAELMVVVKNHRTNLGGAGSAAIEDILKESLLMDVDLVQQALREYNSWVQSRVEVNLPTPSTKIQASRPTYKQHIDRIAPADLSPALLAHCLVSQASSDVEADAPIRQLQSILNPAVWMAGPQIPAAAPEGHGTEADATRRPSTVSIASNESAYVPPAPKLNVSLPYFIQDRTDCKGMSKESVAFAVRSRLKQLGLAWDANRTEEPPSEKAAQALACRLDIRTVEEVTTALNEWLGKATLEKRNEATGDQDPAPFSTKELVEALQQWASKHLDVSANPDKAQFLQNSVQNTLSMLETQYILVLQQTQAFLQRRFPNLREAELAEYLYAVPLESQNDFYVNVVAKAHQSLAPMGWTELNLVDVDGNSTGPEKPTDPVKLIVGAVEVPPSRRSASGVKNVYTGLPSFLNYMASTSSPTMGDRTAAAGEGVNSYLNEKRFYRNSPSASVSPAPNSKDQRRATFSAEPLESSQVVFPYDGSVVEAVTSGRSRRVSWQKAELVASLNATISQHALNQFFVHRKADAKGISRGATSPTQKAKEELLKDDGTESVASGSIAPSNQDVARESISPSQGITPNGSMMGTPKRKGESNALKFPPGAALTAPGAGLGKPPLPTQAGTGVGLVIPPEGQQDTPFVTELPRFSVTYEDAVSFSVETIATPLSAEGPMPTTAESASLIAHVSGRNLTVTFDECSTGVGFLPVSAEASGLATSVIQVYCPVSKCVKSLAETEASRVINRSNASVARYFASGQVYQVLHRGGGSSTAYRPYGEVDYVSWIHRKPSGARVVQLSGRYAQLAEKEGQSVTFALPNVGFRSAVDAESRSKIRSFEDGTMTIQYLSEPEYNAAEGGTSLPTTASVGRIPGSGPSVHTVVTLHPDGTKMISFMAGGKKIVTPIPSATIDGVGVRAFRIENPGTLPSVDLFAGSNHIYRDLMIEFNDGSIFRHSAPSNGGGSLAQSGASFNAEAGRTTTFIRPAESAIRIDHGLQLIMVEPSTVQFKERKPPSVAACEGIGIFDLLNGAFRLIDYRHYLTEVYNVVGGEVAVENPIVVKFTRSSIDDILLSLSPSGIDHHARPKKLHSTTLAKQRAAREKASNEQEVGHQLPHFVYPCLLYRLRPLVKPYVSSLRLGVGRTSFAETIKAPLSESWMDTEIRPELYYVRRDGSIVKLLCNRDVTPLVHLSSKNPTITVNTSSFSGEPGIEQISFLWSAPGGVAQGAARSLVKSMKGTNIWAGSLSACVTTKPFDQTLHNGSPAFAKTAGVSSTPGLGGVEGLSWIPRSVLPPKAPRQTHDLTAFDIAVRQSSLQCLILQRLLRFSPVSAGVKAAVLQTFVQRQRHKTQMKSYGLSLILEDPRPEVERLAAARLRIQHQESIAKSIVNSIGTFSGVTFVGADGSPEPSAAAGQSSTVVVAGNTNDSTKSKVRGEHQWIVPSSEEIQFGTLPLRFKYSLTLTLTNTSTNALMFQVRRADLKDTVVTVQHAKGLISPMSSSVVIIVASILPSLPRGVERETKLFIDCQGCRKPIVVPVRIRVATEEEDFAYCIEPHVKVLGPVT